jgi:hypothetical protein
MGKLLCLGGVVTLDNELVLDGRHVLFEVDVEAGGLGGLDNLAPLVDGQAHESLEHLDAAVADLDGATGLNCINSLCKGYKRQASALCWRAAALQGDWGIKPGENRMAWEVARTVLGSEDDATGVVTNKSLGNLELGAVRFRLVDENLEGVNLELEIEARLLRKQVGSVNDCWNIY